MTQPVIILGMHRSGTSLLTRLLAQWGLFVGETVEQNHEAVTFLQLNEWMFYQANASWDRPDNMDLIDDELWSMMLESVSHVLAGPSKKQFLGQQRAAKYSSLKELDFPWGWKDPRSIFTMPVWNKLYPSAKLINITRHPLDVAYSIASREKYRFSEIKSLVQKTGVGSVVDKGQKFRTTVRGLDIYEGISLWRAYVGKANSVIEKSEADVLTIQYEKLLADPINVARKIANFAGLEPSEDILKASVAGINSDRRYAYRKRDELMSAYQTIGDDRLIRAMGYVEE